MWLDLTGCKCSSLKSKAWSIEPLPHTAEALLSSFSRVWTATLEQESSGMQIEWDAGIHVRCALCAVSIVNTTSPVFLRCEHGSPSSTPLKKSSSFHCRHGLMVTLSSREDFSWYNFGRIRILNQHCSCQYRCNRLLSHPWCSRLPFNMRSECSIFHNCSLLWNCLFLL